MPESSSTVPGWDLSSARCPSLAFGAGQAWQAAQPLPVSPASPCIPSLSLYPQPLPLSPSLSCYLLSSEIARVGDWEERGRQWQ